MILSRPIGSLATVPSGAEFGAGRSDKPSIGTSKAGVGLSLWVATSISAHPWLSMVNGSVPCVQWFNLDAPVKRRRALLASSQIEE